MAKKRRQLGIKRDLVRLREASKIQIRGKALTRSCSSMHLMHSGVSWPVSWSSSKPRHPENFEWHVLQRMDRRFRACQAVSDAATNMFNTHGRRLDRADHRALLRTLLRSLDPLCVHDPEMTEAFDLSTGPLKTFMLTHTLS